MKPDQILFKRLIREYEFLLEDLNDLNEIKSKVDQEFMKHLQEIDDEGILDSSGIESAAAAWDEGKKAEIEKEIEEQDDRDPIFKKLFRSIVVKCHPDKLGTLNTEDQKYYNNLYGDAIDANETINWALLIRTAIKLEIEIPEGAYSKIEEIQADLDKLKAKQEAILNSTSWNWYNIKDTNNQDELLKNHLNFLKGFGSI